MPRLGSSVSYLPSCRSRFGYCATDNGDGLIGLELPTYGYRYGCRTMSLFGIKSFWNNIVSGGSDEKVDGRRKKVNKKNSPTDKIESGK